MCVTPPYLRSALPFGQDAPRSDYDWKEYYYCDYVLLHFHRVPGRTVLLVTHDESEAAYLAENVFTLPSP